MEKVAEKDLNTMRRRLASVNNHLVPGHSDPSPSSVGLSNTSMSDSYHRIHGEVPTHPVVWRSACDDSGKDFVDIIYEKSVGEGIAKVRFLFRFFLF